MSKAIEDWKTMKYGRAIFEEELKKRTHPAWPYMYFNPGKPVDPAKVDEILKGVDRHSCAWRPSWWLAGRKTPN